MRLVTAGSLLCLLLSGCGQVGEEAAQPSTTSPEATPADRSTPAAPDSARTPADRTGGPPDGDDGAGGPHLGASCSGAEGIGVRYPTDWSENPGLHVPPCTRFAPEPFQPRPGTDARLAAVVVDVEPVPYDRASADRTDETSRREVRVDGRGGVRIERVTDVGLYPQGTPVTSYLVDLGSDADGRPRTLVADTVGLGRWDHDRNVEVLDAMVAALDLDAAL